MSVSIRYNKMQTLRTYQHIAHKEHWCDRCCTHINPGEMYEGNVTITENHGLMVWKFHLNPRCDFPEDPDEEERNKDNIIESLINASPLPLAA